jgi:hypothetical protein
VQERRQSRGTLRIFDLTKSPLSADSMPPRGHPTGVFRLPRPIASGLFARFILPSASDPLCRNSIACGTDLVCSNRPAQSPLFLLALPTRASTACSAAFLSTGRMPRLAAIPCVALRHRSQFSCRPCEGSMSTMRTPRILFSAFRLMCLSLPFACCTERALSARTDVDAPVVDTARNESAGRDFPISLTIDASPSDSANSSDTRDGTLEASGSDRAPVYCRSSSECPDFYFCLIPAAIADCLQGPVGTCVRIYQSNCVAYAGCGCLHLSDDPCIGIPGTWCDTIPPLYGTLAGQTGTAVCAACLPKRDGGLEGAMVD